MFFCFLGCKNGAFRHFLSSKLFAGIKKIVLLSFEHLCCFVTFLLGNLGATRVQISHQVERTFCLLFLNECENIPLIINE